MTQIIKLAVFIPALCLSACGGDDVPAVKRLNIDFVHGAE